MPISGNKNIGGIAGYVKNSFIKECENNAPMQEIQTRDKTNCLGGIVRI
jgi:hypothetical protein